MTITGMLALAVLCSCHIEDAPAEPDAQAPPADSGADGADALSCAKGDEHCSESEDCCGLGGACLSHACSADCDPVTSEGCTSEEGCQLAKSGAAKGPGGSYTECREAGDRQHGEPCADYAWSCAPGHLCRAWEEDGVYRCSQYCELGGAECAEGACRALGYRLSEEKAYGTCE